MMVTATAPKLDLTKTDKNYYTSGLTPEIQDFDSYYYLSIQGQSSPEDARFLKAIEAIYAIAYGIKFLCKGEDCDFVVPKMECHWYVNGGPEVQDQFTTTPMDEWMWKILIRMPDCVEFHHYYQSMNFASGKKPALKGLIDQVKLELINEGKCAQIMHIGSWDEEGPSVEKLHQYITDQGFSISGYHKEIYISDPRRIAEEKKKTILRYQIQ